jgi:hypothetical protein
MSHVIGTLSRNADEFAIGDKLGRVGRKARALLVDALSDNGFGFLFGADDGDRRGRARMGERRRAKHESGK